MGHDDHPRPEKASVELKRLKTWAVILPITFLFLLEALQYWVLEPQLASATVHLITLGLMLIGVLLFSTAVWQSVEKIEGEVHHAYTAERQYALQLSALHEAALQITTELNPDRILKKMVQLSCEVVGCRYGALAVFGEGGSIDQFLTEGIDEATRARLGPPPTGHGLLGELARTRRPLRLDDVAKHPHFSGFPPNHPPMKTLLAVPVMYKDSMLGDLYLSEKLNGQPFTEQDQQTLERFAAQAAVAVANARLYERVQRLSAVEERERIAMDLHDGVIQSIYGVGLTLEGVLDKMDTSREQAYEDVNSAIDRLGRIVTDIRNYILDLRGHRLVDSSFGDLMNKLLDSIQAGPRIVRDLQVEGDFTGLTRSEQWELWHIAHEALTNAVRHGEPSRLEVKLKRLDRGLYLNIRDDGHGFDLTQLPTLSTENDVAHHGLRNMADRVRKLKGEFRVLSAPGRGTSVEVLIPLEATHERTSNVRQEGLE